MREILFRAKHIHALPQNEHLDGTWVYGYLCDENYINTVDEDEYGEKFASEMLIDPETVCQYTGVNDNARWEQLSKYEKKKFLSEWNYDKDRRNIKEDWSGRKIFEGDIVKINDDVKRTFRISDGVVIYRGGSFIIGESNGGGTLNSLFTIADFNYVLRGEVIGNIFDNPELIGE